MKNEGEKINLENDVIYLYQQQIQDVYNTQIAFQLLGAIQQIWSKLRSPSEAQLFDEGLECYLLSPGKQWRMGKLKMRFEFHPDESNKDKIEANNQLENSQKNSPLEDLREKLKEIDE